MVVVAVVEGSDGSISCAADLNPEDASVGALLFWRFSGGGIGVYVSVPLWYEAVCAGQWARGAGGV